MNVFLRILHRAVKNQHECTASPARFTSCIPPSCSSLTFSPIVKHVLKQFFTSNFKTNRNGYLIKTSKNSNWVTAVKLPVSCHLYSNTWLIKLIWKMQLALKESIRPWLSAHIRKREHEIPVTPSGKLGTSSSSPSSSSASFSPESCSSSTPTDSSSSLFTFLACVSRVSFYRRQVS